MVVQRGIKALVVLAYVIALVIGLSDINERNITYSVARYDEGDYEVQNEYTGEEAKSIEKFFDSTEWSTVDLDIVGVPEYVLTQTHTSPKKINLRSAKYHLYFLENNGEIVCITSEGFRRITVYENKEIYNKIVKAVVKEVQ